MTATTRTRTTRTTRTTTTNLWPRRRASAACSSIQRSLSTIRASLRRLANGRPVTTTARPLWSAKSMPSDALLRGRRRFCARQRAASLCRSADRPAADAKEQGAALACRRRQRTSAHSQHTQYRRWRRSVRSQLQRRKVKRATGDEAARTGKCGVAAVSLLRRRRNAQRSRSTSIGAPNRPRHRLPAKRAPHKSRTPTMRQRRDIATLARRMAASVDVCGSSLRVRRARTLHSDVATCCQLTKHSSLPAARQRRVTTQRVRRGDALVYDGKKTSVPCGTTRAKLRIVWPNAALYWRRPSASDATATRATVSVSRVANDELSDVPSAPTRAHAERDGRRTRTAARTGAVRDDAHKDLIAAAAVGRNDAAATRRRPADDVRILEAHVKGRRQFADVAADVAVSDADDASANGPRERAERRQCTAGDDERAHAERRELEHRNAASAASVGIERSEREMQTPD